MISLLGVDGMFRRFWCCDLQLAEICPNVAIENARLPVHDDLGTLEPARFYQVQILVRDLITLTIMLGLCKPEH